MKNVEAVYAYQVLRKLNEQPMDIRVTYKLLQLQKRLCIIYDSYVEAERMLLEKYQLMDKLDGNRIHFDLDDEGQKIAKAYKAEHTDLEQMEADLPETKPILIQDGNAFNISMEDLHAIEAFVTIQDPDEDSGMQ